MSFSRVEEPRALYRGRDLSGSLAGIGFGLAAEPRADANIEDTLLAASVDGMERGKLRVLAMLVGWLEVHAARVNADRLVRLVKASESARVRAFWAAVGVWLEKDRRFSRLVKLHRGKRVELGRRGGGEDPRFEGGPLRMPAGALRQRPGDVVAPGELVERHAAYRYRVLIGPSYRADMWAELSREPELAATELARRTYGSYATAWQVKRDYELVGEAT